MDLAGVDHILTTTRSVRRRLDFRRPVNPAVLRECLEIAVQAPAGGNLARYHFVIVTDPAKRAAVSDYYRRVFFEEYLPRRPEVVPDIPEREKQFTDSATYLAQHLHEVPVLVIPCVLDRPPETDGEAQAGFWGGILPAVLRRLARPDA